MHQCANACLCVPLARLQAQYLMLVWDTPAHMAEETKDAARVVPKAIMTSYMVGGFLNIGLLISYLACLNLDNYQYSGDYDSNFGLPLAEKDNRVAAGNFLYLGVTNGLFPIGSACTVLGASAGRRPRSVVAACFVADLLLFLHASPI